jgi:hypothetical protein
LWFGQTDARPIALMRIAFGAMITIQLLQRFTVARKAYSSEGYLTQKAAAAFVSDWQWSLFFVYDAPWFVQSVILLGVAGAVLFTLGHWTRVAGIVAFIALTSLHNRNSFSMYGGDIVPRQFLFYLLLMTSDRVWSVRAWRARLRASHDAVQRGKDPRSAPRRAATIDVWPVRLFQIQIMILYLCTGLHKAQGIDYHDGSALWYGLVNPATSRLYPWGFPLYRAIYPVLELSTFFTLWWELLFPFMVPFRRLRPIALWGGVFVHGGIAVFMQVGWWAPIMLLSYLAFVSGRPFARVRLANLRQRRTQVARAQRVELSYDEGDARAVQLAARIAAIDDARLIRLKPRAGPLGVAVNHEALKGAEARAALRRVLGWRGRLLGTAALETAASSHA